MPPEIDETLGFHGEAVKALGNGKVAGLLVRFGSPSDTDAEGEYFTSRTDFGLDTATKARVLYHHGMTREYGKQRLGVVDLSLTDEGVHAAGALDLSVPAAKAIYADVEAGKLGWSSGSSSHLRERQATKGGAVEILSWPIIEASLTPAPAERRNRAYAIKSLMEDITGGTAPVPSLIERSRGTVSDLAELVGLYSNAVKAVRKDGRPPLSAAKLAELEALGTAASEHADAIKALCALARPRPDAAKVRALRASILLSEIGFLIP